MRMKEKKRSKKQFLFPQQQPAVLQDGVINNNCPVMGLSHVIFRCLHFKPRDFQSTTNHGWIGQQKVNENKILIFQKYRRYTDF